MQRPIDTILLALLVVAAAAAVAIGHVDAERAHRDAVRAAEDRARTEAVVDGMNETLNVIAQNTGR